MPLTKLAVLTGLDTRTINKIMDEKKNAQPLHTREKFLRMITPESSLLDLWSSSSKYLNKENSDPLILKLKGESPSF